MANDVFTVYSQGLTLYFVVVDPSVRVWNTSTNAFEAVNISNWGLYTIPMTEDVAGQYHGFFPTSIHFAGTYSLVGYQQLGASPATTDTAVTAGEISWNGHSEVVGGGGGGGGSNVQQTIIPGVVERFRITVNSGVKPVASGISIITGVSNP